MEWLLGVWNSYHYYIIAGFIVVDIVWWIFYSRNRKIKKSR